MKLDTIKAIGDYVHAVTGLVSVSDLRWHTLEAKILSDAAANLLAAMEAECAAIAAEVDADDAKETAAEKQRQRNMPKMPGNE